MLYILYKAKGHIEQRMLLYVLQIFEVSKMRFQSYQGVHY